MGIRQYKKILLNQLGSFPAEKYYLRSYSRSGCEEFIKRAQRSERAHVLMAVVMLLYTIFYICFWVDGLFDLLVIFVLTLLNIITNIYPICLQRYHRIRIHRILDRHQRKQP